MKKLAILFISILVIGAVFNFESGGVRDKDYLKTSDVKENGNNILTNSFKGNYQYSSVLDTHGAIPGMTGYYDYMTNGNNLHKLWILGDTVLVSVDQTDSASAQTSTARTSYYQVSFDGGLTWLSEALAVSSTGNAYPDIVPIISSGARTVSLAGRKFVSGGRKGYVGVDVVLTAGTFTITLNRGQGSDNFTALINSNTLACAYINFYGGTTSDSLFYAKFNTDANQFTGDILLTGNPSEIATNVRQYIAANANQNVAVGWWFPTEPTKMLAKESSNNGTSFGSTITVITSGFVANGDQIAPWFQADMIYKPGTTIYGMAFSSLAPGNFGTAQGSKLMYWSPTINGGNPVVIVDWHNAPANAMIKDTTYYNEHYSPNNHQVGMTALSSPSLSYSSDGSKLYCVYTVVQKDTSSYSFFFNDVCMSTSTDNGATWGTPVILTNTATSDETYPTISKTQNTNNSVTVTYNLSECPGSASFTNTSTPVCRVWQVLRRYDPVTGSELPIGIVNISNEVPQAFSLQQNYPNPFNPVTKIRFSIVNKTEVSIKVYDITGRLVSVIANNETVTPGVKEVEFDAGNLSSGVYFYTMQTPEFSATKKMVLVK